MLQPITFPSCFTILVRCYVFRGAHGTLLTFCSELSRTTDGKGMRILIKRYPFLGSNVVVVGYIRERTWYGPNGIKHIRTVKEPKQAIPTFLETIDLLMKVSVHISVHRPLTIYIYISCVSLRTSTSNSTSTSKCRMTLPGYSRLCTRSSQLSLTGRPSSLLVCYSVFGILNSWSRPRPTCLTVAAVILARVPPLPENTSGKIAMPSRWLLPRSPPLMGRSSGQSAKLRTSSCWYGPSMNLTI